LTGGRADSHRLQEQALPYGRVLITCPAPLGSGGLGRHLKELLNASERVGVAAECLCASSPALAPARLAQRVISAGVAPLGRASRAWRMWQGSVAFDGRAAAAMPPCEHLIAFNGAAHAQFDVARKAEWRSLQLVSANSHYRRVIERHALAHRQYPVERPWVTRLLRRNLVEYEQADRILVASDYIHESFVERGVDEARLVRFPLTPDPRYAPAADGGASRAEELQIADGSGDRAEEFRIADGSECHAEEFQIADGSECRGEEFQIVYVGSLTVHKGVPLLLDALRRLAQADIRLVLVGGWGTRGMRRHVERACAEDRRVSVAPGDPLPHLRRADLCVHPAYEDGFGYAPAEALAAGVPLIVSEDTGMKELIAPGETGVVVPTGDRKTLVEAIEAAYAGRLLDG
jgi:glycosyltransferase involved in cell wall biosynthesis